MINKFIKKSLLILTIITMFFIGINKVSAQTCTWYTYESGVYYDSKTGVYKPVKTSSGLTYTYKLTFDGDKFNRKNAGGDSNFYDNVIRDEINSSGECPIYIGVTYYRKGKNDTNTVRANKSDYTNYLKNQYNGKIIDSNNNTVEYSGYLDAKFNIEANDKESDKDMDPIYYSNVSTNNKKTLKLDPYSSELKEEFNKTVMGLADKDKDTTYKDSFYENTKSMWKKAIKQTYNNVKNSCSAYTNSSTQNREAYLDLLDNDIYEDFLEQNKIDTYEQYLSSSNDSVKIPNEQCYDAVINAKYMQASFVIWFQLVDWISLTKCDDKNDFTEFYDFYEFAYLQVAGGDHVRAMRDILNTRAEGNDAVDEYNKTISEMCNSLCTSQKNSSQAYNECLKSSIVKSCITAEDYCRNTRCLHVSSDDGACFDSCMRENLGETTYDDLKRNYEQDKTNYNDIIEESIESMISTLNTIKSPTLSGINFGGYKANCDDVEFLNDIYVVLKILAPVLVILMGTIDFTKSVIAGDEKKIVEARKKFPKRLALLILFILIPFIIEILLDAFSGVETSLMRCVIKGA